MTTDLDAQPLVEEEEPPPPRLTLRRVVRWVVVVSIATIGMMAVATIVQEPL